ncbi:MAG TPA: hypothetical protein VGI99_08305 [Gemmataceae bacterium]|jgi:hypothetical protein
MKVRTAKRWLLASLVLAALCALIGIGHAADPRPAQDRIDPLVVHEWGTFTSFSGSDGVPAHFLPNYTDLPEFIYSQAAPRESKIARLERDCTISMETPVLYFYTERSLKASVKVEFPRGWITEWYPFASTAPVAGARLPGQSIQWDVRLAAGEDLRLPNVRSQDHYGHARETDSVPLQVAVNGSASRQAEKFLFYRGAATFPLPVSIRAIEGGWVRVANDTNGTVKGLMLVNVEGDKVGFKVLGPLDAAETVRTSLPTADGKSADAAAAMIKLLVAAGLFEKEAKAMVKTWESAWFGESGARVLSLVPRSRTDQLLPLTIVPKPTEVARVLVGRHDFLLPAHEARVEQLVKRVRANQDRAGAQAELQKIGRFSLQAIKQAERRIDGIAP